MERMILLKYLNIAKFLDISAKSSFYIKYISYIFFLLLFHYKIIINK